MPKGLSNFCRYITMGSLAREENLDRLRDRKAWDVVVIGGGATGLGSAVDAASRGYRTLLLEAFDFAHGTSSRSTKLIHGGVRYLAQGNFGLVREALHGAESCCAMRRIWFIAATSWSRRTRWLALPYYGMGLKLYDWMSGSLGLGHSRWARPRRSSRELLRSARRGCAEESSTPTDSSTTPGWRSGWRGHLPNWAARPSTT